MLYNGLVRQCCYLFIILYTHMPILTPKHSDWFVNSMLRKYFFIVSYIDVMLRIHKWHNLKNYKECFIPAAKHIPAKVRLHLRQAILVLLSEDVSPHHVFPWEFFVLLSTKIHTNCFFIFLYPFGATFQQRFCERFLWLCSQCNYCVLCTCVPWLVHDDLFTVFLWHEHTPLVIFVYSICIPCK